MLSMQEGANREVGSFALWGERKKRITASNPLRYNQALSVQAGQK